MYILKTKGTGKIPDYIQIRDNNFVLINHFKADKSNNSLKQIYPENRINEILTIIKNLNYGKLIKIK